VAAPIKYSARIYHHAGRVHFPCDDTLDLNLHAATREDDAVKSPRDNHAIAFDLAFNLGALAKDHGLFRDDVAFDISINAKRPFECQCTFKQDALIDKTCPLFVDTMV